MNKKKDPDSPERPPDNGVTPSAGVSNDLLDAFLEHFSKVEATQPATDQSRYLHAKHQASLHRLELDRHVVLVARIKQFTSLRWMWSSWIIVWINTLLIFQISLLFLVGFKWLDYLSYDWLLPVVLLQVFGQIVGMGFVVVRFLYPTAEAVSELPPLPSNSN